MMVKAIAIERTTKLSRGKGCKRPGGKLKAFVDFQRDTPRLHNDDDIKVVTINGNSYGMVRRLGAAMFLWSNAAGEGRENTEEAAFLRLGFHYFLDCKGEHRIKKVGSK